MECGVFFTLYTTFAGLLMMSRCYGVPFDADAVSSVIQSSVECHSNPSVAVGVIKDGKVLLSRGFGVLDVDKNANVSSDTLFGIASITKSFTATLMVKLLSEKTNLTVNSKVRELLGDKFQMPDDLRTQETTFADLLAHRTAVPPNNRMRYDNNLTRENLLERFPMLVSPHPFRVDYFYSNLMYGLITRLSEIIGKDRWENLVIKHIFQPLGMDRTTLVDRLDFEGETNRAQPYMELDGHKVFQRVTPELSRKWAELSGSGSILSTSTDMLKWAHFHLNGGKNGQGEQVMAPEAFAELHKPRFLITYLSGKYIDVPTFPVASIDNSYAFGLRNGHYRGYEKITHSGSTTGYRSLMTLLPTENIGVITLLTGRDDHYLHRLPLHMYLLDSALGLKPWLNRSTMCTFPEPWKEKPNVPAFRPAFDRDLALRLDSTKYEGVYHNDAYGYMTVHYNSTLGSLTMSYGFGKWHLRLWPSPTEKRERFFATGAPPVFPFDVKPIFFVSHPENDDVIVGVNATAFENRVPPVFCRPDDREVCLDAIFKVQTYNVGHCRVKGCDVNKSGHGHRIEPIKAIYVVIYIVSLTFF